MSLFIVLEGGEGSGKSTQTKLLYSRLLQEAYTPFILHEPGGTPIGEEIRRAVKSQRGATGRSKRKAFRTDISPITELLLFSAARAELVTTVLRPALKEDRVVLCDRFTPSTIAYQSYGRGLPLEIVLKANELAAGDIKPDIVFLLDLPPEEGLRRVNIQAPLIPGSEIPQLSPRINLDGDRRFEEEPLAFHKRVRRGYLTLSKGDPTHWVVIDGTLPQNQIEAIIWDHIAPLLPKENR